MLGWRESANDVNDGMGRGAINGRDGSIGNVAGCSGFIVAATGFAVPLLASDCDSCSPVGVSGVTLRFGSLRASRDKTQSCASPSN